MQVRTHNSKLNSKLSQSNFIFMTEIRNKKKTINNKRNSNTKWLLLQNYQNADMTSLHSHDEMSITIFLLYVYALPKWTCAIISNIMSHSLKQPCHIPGVSNKIIHLVEN